MTRREARELVMQMLFETTFHPEDNQEVILQKALTDKKGKVKQFIEDTYLGVLANREAIDDIIKTSSEHWSLERIAKVDLMLLRMAVYEMKWGADVPTKVAINEAIEIAKVYSTDKSPKFVHGLLGKISKTIEG